MLQKVFIMNTSSKKKILHRAKYRGIKELDIVFERFVTRYGFLMDDHEIYQLEEILNLPDNFLLDIILRKEKVPANLDNNVMKKRLHNSLFSSVYWVWHSITIKDYIVNKLSETYNYFNQSKSIISDKHTRKYESLNNKEKFISRMNVWGV